jgi:hypothetical protein
MSIRNQSAYLGAVISDFAGQVTAGFPDEYAAKTALWKAAVTIWEVADDPDVYLDQLRELTLACMRPTRAEATIRSAERRAAR